MSLRCGVEDLERGTVECCGTCQSSFNIVINTLENSLHLHESAVRMGWIEWLAAGVQVEQEGSRTELAAGSRLRKLSGDAGRAYIQEGGVAGAVEEHGR